MSDNRHPPEIIIIKRGNEEEEAHHGGAWKIAFADFMTAMMALFLVLWLINAANEETKRAVASYFNPVKLVDRNRSSKGINEQKGGPTSEAGDGVAKPATPESVTTKSLSATAPHDVDQRTNTAEEAAFFAAPLDAIDVIKDVGVRLDPEMYSSGEDKPASSADIFSDPFMPLKPDKSVDHKVTEAPSHAAPDGASGQKDQQDVSDQQKQQAAVDAIKGAIHDALESETAAARQLEASIEVKATDKGILISVSDTLKNPMFEVGSAVPSPSMVLAVEAISKTLAERAGGIHILGHTDGRQFQNEPDGNWRLSTQRARATYYILLHGGLPDARIQEITGRADRQLQNMKDPLSGENRRIEILLGSK